VQKREKGNIAMVALRLETSPAKGRIESGSHDRFMRTCEKEATPTGTRVPPLLFKF